MYEECDKFLVFDPKTAVGGMSLISKKWTWLYTSE